MSNHNRSITKGDCSRSGIPEKGNLPRKSNYAQHGAITLDQDLWTVTFGKHKGKTLSDIPRKYLLWMLSNVALTDDQFKVIESAAGIDRQHIPQPSPDSNANKQWWRSDVKLSR